MAAVGGAAKLGTHQSNQAENPLGLSPLRDDDDTLAHVVAEAVQGHPDEEGILFALRAQDAFYQGTPGRPQGLCQVRPAQGLQAALEDQAGVSIPGTAQQVPCTEEKGSFL